VIGLCPPIGYNFCCQKAKVVRSKF
jgi:hypothetical protein